VLEKTSCPSRRLNSRVQTTQGVWVYWCCDGRAETSPVRDISLGGLFIETARSLPVGSVAQVEFLVQEGQIRTQSLVRRLEPGGGVGLKLTAVKDGDRVRFVQLINRLRNLCHSYR
jgi:PilZ domain